MRGAEREAEKERKRRRERETEKKYTENWKVDLVQNTHRHTSHHITSQHNATRSISNPLYTPILFAFPDFLGKKVQKIDTLPPHFHCKIVCPGIKGTNIQIETCICRTLCVDVGCAAVWHTHTQQHTRTQFIFNFSHLIKIDTKGFYSQSLRFRFAFRHAPK